MHINQLQFEKGSSWVKQGFELYKKAPFLWIGILICYWIVNLIAKGIPGVGFIISEMLSNFLLVGMMIGCQELELNNNLTFEHLFSGFSKNAASLLVLSLIESSIILVAIGMAIAACAVIIGPSIIISLINSKPETISSIFELINPGIIITVILISLFFILSVLFIVTSFMYAPYLIAFKNQKALEAMKNSFNATLLNMMPLTYTGLIYLGIFVLCLLTLGFGFLIVGPMMFCSFYYSFKDIFEEKSNSEPVSPY